MKRKQLINTARHLFFKFGIKRVSVEEICQEARVSKTTFYKNFKNKNELVKTMIMNIMEESLVTYRKIMDSDLPFEEKIRETIKLKHDSTEQMSREFLDDYLPHAEPGLQKFIQKKSQETMSIVVKDYAEAQKRGDIRGDIKIEFILWYLNRMIDMAGDETLSAMYDNPQEMIMEIVNMFFYGITSRKSGDEDSTIHHTAQTGN